jgi:hypothetical protein
VEERSWTFLGHRLQPDELRLIQAVVADCTGLSRGELAATICELLAWTRPTGRVKDRECRTLLEALAAAGVINLPAKQTGRPLGARTAVPQTIHHETMPRLTGTVRDIAPVTLERVRTPEARRLFRELVGRYHYLGYAVPYGAHLQYLVYAAQPACAVVGCVQCTSAAWRLGARDAWIGWDDATRARQLPRLVNNSRLLIAPWVQVRNLASTILSQLTRGLAADWQAAYGVMPLLLETLVDPTRFAGTGYRAANWIPVGLTTGRGRTGRRRPTRSAKRVFVYPLVRDAVAQLRGA